LLELLRDDLVSADLPAVRQRIKQAMPVMPRATAMQSLQWRLELARSDLLEGHVDPAIDALHKLEGEFKAAGARELEVETLQVQAGAELSRGRLNDALAITTRSLQLLRQLRLAVGDPELRVRLTSLHRSAYELHVAALDSLRVNTSDAAQKENLLLQMFATADEAGAGLLREGGNAAVPSDESANTRELREVAGEIAFHEHILAALETGTAPGANEKKLRAELAVLRARYDSLTPASTPVAGDFAPADYRIDGIRRNLDRPVRER